MWADDNVLKGPAIWLNSELASVADMLASLVASRVTNITGVATLALAMLTEFVWAAELTITAMTTVLANASTTTILTHAALTTVRALASLTFDFGSQRALHSRHVFSILPSRSTLKPSAKKHLVHREHLMVSSMCLTVFICISFL